MRNPADELASTCLKAGVSIRDLCKVIGWENSLFHKWRRGEGPSAGTNELLNILSNTLRKEMDAGRLPVKGQIERHRRMLTSLKLREALKQAGISGADSSTPME